MSLKVHQPKYIFGRKNRKHSNSTSRLQKKAVIRGSVSEVSSDFVDGDTVNLPGINHVELSFCSEVKDDFGDAGVSEEDDGVKCSDESSTFHVLQEKGDRESMIAELIEEWEDGLTEEEKNGNAVIQGEDIRLLTGLDEKVVSMEDFLDEPTSFVVPRGGTCTQIWDNDGGNLTVIQKYNNGGLLQEKYNIFPEISHR